MCEDWIRPVVHWDIQAREPEKIRAFYSQMFNWPIGEGPIMSIPLGVGIPDGGPAGHIMGGDRPGLALYIQVRDLGESMERAKTLGGEVLSEPFHIPGGATIAGIADPEGNRVVLVQQ